MIDLGRGAYCNAMSDTSDPLAAVRDMALLQTDKGRQCYALLTLVRMPHH